MHEHEFHFFDKDMTQTVEHITDNTEYAAGDGKSYNGKNYKIIYRITHRVTANSDLIIAVEI